MKIIAPLFCLIAIGAAAVGPQHASSLTVKLTLLNGASRTATLEGVGCSERMCSRVAVNSKARGDAAVTHTWLDSLAGVRDIAQDDALFRFKDGTERRLSVVPLNRVLYLQNASGASEKLDLSQVKALEFVSPNSK
jgi:hypothetical protein